MPPRAHVGPREWTQLGRALRAGCLAALAACAERTATESQRAALPAPPEELRLLSALPVETVEENFQPSALLLQAGRLLTVSDKHDVAIYSLDVAEGVARARPAVTFAPPPDEPAPLDFEGLAPAGDGGWLISSESRSRVLHVPPPEPPGAERPQARWLTPSLREPGRAAGHFSVPNAGFEGVARLPGGGVLLAIERQPRGLIELGAQATAAPQVWPLAGSIYPFQEPRTPDFTDLSLHRGVMYVLARNAHLIVRLERASGGGWREGRAFSFRAAEEAPAHRYEDRTYGLAEGLAVSDSEVFVVLDNNGQGRVADPGDRRPLLFVFERPSGL